METKLLPKQKQSADLDALRKALAPEIIDGKELARRLQCTIRTIDNWSAAGIIKRIKVGRLVRYNWGKVVESLEEGA